MDERQMSRDELEEQMWDGLVPAWLSGSAAACAVAWAAFWLLVLRWPDLVIRYDDEHEVWTYNGLPSADLYRGPTAPPAPLDLTDLTTVVAALFFIAVAAYFSRDWFAAHGELTRRRREKRNRRNPPLPT
jgi:hypothetical protein